MLLALLAAAAVPHGAISPERLSADIKVLASDEFEGRGPGTEGERKTIDFLIKQFKAAGPQPAGENGGWTQAVEMRRHTVADQRVLRVTGKTCDIDLTPDAVLSTRNPAPRVDLHGLPVVFAGYGIHAPDRGWDDYSGLDVRGKLVLVLPNDPDFQKDSGPFGGKAMSYYARSATKVEEAGRRGAAAVLVIADPDRSEYDWATFKNLYKGPASGVPDADADLVRFSGYVTPKVSKELFACSGLDLATEITKAGESGFGGEPLAGLSAKATFDVAVQKLVTHNVVAKIPGAKYPGEYFAYTAHWDHLGRGKPDRTGDDIYNGALDNAGGVAGLLELARAFGHGRRPQRSILFIAMTLEESGLLGSEYFASHPLVPLEKVAGGFNMDAVNLFGETGTMEVTSMGQTTLEDHLKAELAKQGREMKDDPNSVVGFYYRSDHFPFAKRGVPFIFAGSGWELAEKTAPNTREPEVGTRFHQPSDEWSPDLDFKAAARDVEIYYRVGKVIANSREWPRWNPGTEFKAAREESDALRP